jgi:hypothetical protein
MSQSLRALELEVNAREPWTLAAILLRAANSGLFAALKAQTGRFDPLTSHLVTNPGVLCKVMAITAVTVAWLPFITAMQTLRLLTVMVWGSALARVSFHVSGAARISEVRGPRTRRSGKSACPTDATSFVTDLLLSPSAL